MAQRQRKGSCERKYDLTTRRLSKTHSSESEGDSLASLEQEQALSTPVSPSHSKFAHSWEWDPSSETSEDSSNDSTTTTACKSKVKIKKRDLKNARKKLKHVDIGSSPLPNQLNKFLFTKLPSSFSWRSFPNIAQPTDQNVWAICAIESVLSCMADQFLIANMITQPVQFSSQYLLANYNRHPTDPLMKLEEDSYLCSTEHITGGIGSFELLYFIQQQGVTTTRCMSSLPNIEEVIHQEVKKMVQEAMHKEKDKDAAAATQRQRIIEEKIKEVQKIEKEDIMRRYILDVPKCSCFVENKYLYTFHVSDIRILTLEGIRNFKTLQSVMKRHIYKYGPIISVFIVSKEFYRLFAKVENIRAIESQLKTQYNPEGVFFDYIDYQKTSIDTSTNNVNFSHLSIASIGPHALSIVGWGVAPVYTDVLIKEIVKLVYPQHKGRTVYVPYWLCRNSWGKDQIDEGWIKVAMFPFNQVVSLEGNRTKKVYSPSSKLELNRGSYVCLFKPGAIHRNAEFLKTVNPTSNGEYNFKRADLEFYRSPDPVNPRFIQPPKNPFKELGPIVDEDSYDFDSTKSQSVYPLITNFQKAGALPLIPVSSSFLFPKRLSDDGNKSKFTTKLIIVIIIFIIITAIILLFITTTKVKEEVL